MREQKLPLLMLSSLLVYGTAYAQPQGEAEKYSDVTIQGSILEPEKRMIANDAELIELLKVPDGFQVEVFARDLINPRMLAVSPAGALYATRRSVGDVVMLKDEDGDGKAEAIRTAASRDGMHGIAFDGDRVFLATVNDVYVADVNDDGSFGALHRIINDLPDGGQHPNRTLAIGPDDMLYISAGSTCNACPEPNPENATILRAKKDGTSRTIFASGLRNTIGFDWEPGSGLLYGMDHGIDWLGDQAQIEELNHIQRGKQYGWPYIYGMSEFNPQDNPPEGMTLEQWAKNSIEPLLGYTAHAAPMQMAFYGGASFPEEYSGDAFVAMRGSWNRRPPSGYEVVRIVFERGRPVAAEPFMTGFLINQADGGHQYLARLSGIAVGPEGELFVADDSSGIIYRVTYTGSEATTSEKASIPNPIVEPAPGETALQLMDAEAKLTVTSGFEAGGSLPVETSADGDNASPTLQWKDAPEGTKSFVILMEDPDSAQPKPFVHWIVYDLPSEVNSLREGLSTQPLLQHPEGVKQGKNSVGSIGYYGPKPPVGDAAHNYHFQIFALGISTLELDPGAKREEVLSAMKGHILGVGEIVGQFERPQQAKAE